MKNKSLKYRKGDKVICASEKAFRVIYKGQGYVPVKDESPILEEPKKEESSGGEETQKVLEEMKVDELKALAKERGLTGYSGLSKEDLIEILKGKE